MVRLEKNWHSLFFETYCLALKDSKYEAKLGKMFYHFSKIVINDKFINFKDKPCREDLLQEGGFNLF